MGRNGTEVFGKVFLAILILFFFFSNAQHSSTNVFLLLDRVSVVVWRRRE
jgi:adenylate cyclase